MVLPIPWRLKIEFETAPEVQPLDSALVLSDYSISIVIIEISHQLFLEFRRLFCPCGVAGAEGPRGEARPCAGPVYGVVSLHYSHPAVVIALPLGVNLGIGGRPQNASSFVSGYQGSTIN